MTYTVMLRKKKPIDPERTWQLMDWDGNTELGLKCWRKKFRHGYVSIGVGPDFLTICYSYGANSDDSMSGTRWNYDNVLTEKEAMEYVDACNGKCPCNMRDYEKEAFLQTKWGKWHADSWKRRNEWLKTCTPEVVTAICKYDHLLPEYKRYVAA